jgi:hypothetical protein
MGRVVSFQLLHVASRLANNEAVVRRASTIQHDKEVLH